MKDMKASGKENYFGQNSTRHTEEEEKRMGKANHTDNESSVMTYKTGSEGDDTFDNDTFRTSTVCKSQPSQLIPFLA